MQAAEPRKVVHCPELLHIRSPLLDHLTAWQSGLAAHPDRAFANYITGGIPDGFRIGFSYTRTLNPARRNMPSAEHHPEVVEAYLAGEVLAGRIIGPLPPRNHPRPRADQSARSHPERPRPRQVASDNRLVAPGGHER